MPPALDRLLASPSALRLLRAILRNPDPPLRCSHVRHCPSSLSSGRHYSDKKLNPGKQQWRRWKDAAQDIVQRDQVHQQLDGQRPPTTEASLDIPYAPQSARSPTQYAAAQWAEDLARQERLKGKAGIESSWSSRATLPYTLPTEDTPDAEFLWGTYLKKRSIVPALIEHAAEIMKETGNIYPRLYELVMNHWLRRHPTVALEYHRLMLRKLELSSLPMKALAQSCKSIERPDAYAILMAIYRDSDEKQLYDQVVPALAELGELALARKWHELCIMHDDLPSDHVASHPLVKVFDTEHSMLGVEAGVGSVRAQREARKYNRELLRRLAGRDAAPVRFEDSFTARMFATRTFPPESVIRGLALVGVNEVGPQAVYTMASRTEPLEDLGRVFEALKDSGIALQGSVFSLALEKFTQQENWQLVRSMLESDQHPDVFGDAAVQRTLLKYYIEQNDQSQVQRTLAVLTLFHNDSTQESWNLLLQTHINISGATYVEDMIRDMRARRIFITPESIIAIRSLLRPRQAGRRPGRSTSGNFDDLRFVTGAFMSILKTGIGAISPLHWREIIRRYGMTGRFRELQRVILWLLCWYAPRSSMQFSHLPKSPFLEAATKRLRAAYPHKSHYFHFHHMVLQHSNKKHPVRQLFPPQLIHALIAWGFRAGLLPNASHEQSLYGTTLSRKHYRQRLLKQGLLPRLRWTAGLEAVMHLKSLGVYVHRHTIVKALQAQFVILFGRGRSRIKENRIMEEVNTQPYSVYVREVNRIWGSPLFREPHFFKHGVTHSYMWHPRERRQQNRKESLSLKKLLGSDWQAPARESVLDGVTAHEEALERLKRQFEAQERAIRGPVRVADEILEHQTKPIAVSSTNVPRNAHPI